MDLGEIIVALPFLKWILGSKKEITPSITSDNELFEKMWEAADNNCGEEGTPLEVTIKNQKFNSQAIIKYVPDKKVKFEFRPQNFEQFIGQLEAKERAKTIIKKVKRGIKGHIILDGTKGLGKTTFVKILAKTLNAKLIERIGKQIEEEELLRIINEINTSKEQFIILFIDEIDSMDWKIIKILNPIIESFEINSKAIKPFLFVCATINKHILIKNNPDTLDRIPTHIKFEKYNAEEISRILKQYQEQLYPNDIVPQEVIEKISHNGKYNPRTSISLLEEFIVEKDIEKVLKNSKVIKEGLTNIDVKILKALNEASRPLGANSLAMKCGLSQSEYIREYEPFLVEYNYIERVPSRKITSKGKEILKEVTK